MNKRGIVVISIILTLAMVYASSFSDDSSNFNSGTYLNTFNNGSSIVLRGTNLTGSYTSRIFDASTLSLWNNITQISFTPSLEEFYAVDAQSGVWKSADSGLTWSQVKDDYNNGALNGLNDMARDSSNNLYILDNQDLWKSTDSGVSWAKINEDINGAGDSNQGLVLGITTNNDLFIIDGSEDVLKSVDSGVTFTKVNSIDFNNGNGNVKGLAINSSNTIFAVDVAADIWKSEDSGVSWTKINDDYNGAIGNHATGMAINSSQALFILDEQDLWVSINSGVTWSLVNDDFNGGSDSNAGYKILIDHDNFIYIIDGSEDVYKSTNSGTGFSRIIQDYNGANGGTFGLTSLIKNSNLTFQVRNCSQADCSDGIWQSLNLSNINLISRYFQYQVNFSRDTASLNLSLNNVTLDYTILNAAPSISIILPSNSSYNLIQSALNYTVSDINNNLQTCKYSLNPSSSNTTITCGNNVSGIASTQGNNIWQVWVNDTYGLQASSQVSFFVDSVFPLISITSPSNNARTNNNQLSIDYTASDTNLQSCKYSINGASNSSSSCNQQISSIWNQGTNTILIYAEDILGNTNYSMASFFVDSITPSLSISSPQSQASYGTNTNLELNFSASDTNLQACWYNLDSQANNSINCNQNTTFSTSSGTHTINLFVNDSLGNIASSQVTFEINIGAPTITLNSPINAYLNNSSVNFTFTSSDIDLDSCELWGNWTGWHMNQSKKVTSGVLSFFLLNLTEGNYQWNIKCNDSSSHSSMNGNKSFSVDYTDPQVSLTKPESSYSSKTSIPITFTISDTTNTRCYYNISYQSSGAVLKSNTEIINCSSTSFDVDIDSSYVLWFFANDSSSNSIYINKNFSVSTSSGGSTTTSSGGGGSSSSSSSGTIRYFDITGDSSVLATSGEKKKLELKIKNSVSNFMNDCKIRSYSPWISSSTLPADLNSGQSNDFILDLEVPQETSPGRYNLSLAISCDESNQNFTISLELIEKKLGLELVEAKNTENSLEVNYTLKELSNKPQEITVQITLFNGEEKLAELQETHNLEINEEKNIKTILELDEALSGTFNLVINANSNLASAFIQEEIIASNSKIGGLAVYLRENTANSLVIVFLVAIFGVFAFFILRRILTSRKALKTS